MYKQKEYIVTKNFVGLTKKYFEDIVEPVFNKIKKYNTPVIKTYNIAGKTVSINFFSKLHAENLSRAIAHNEIKTSSKPDLTINTWDSVSTKTHFVSPWISSGYSFDQEVNTKKNIPDLFFGIFLNGERTLNIYDKKNSTAYFWGEDAAELPDWVTGAPFRTIFHWFLSENNTHLIHGSFIGLKDQGILISAAGGSGKSTTALTCLLSGMNYLADDYVGIELSEKITAHSLYSSAKLAPYNLIKFPALQEKVWNKNNLDKEKAIIFLAEMFPEQLISKAKLKAIMIPVIKNTEKTQIVPAGKMQAMLAMMPTTLIQLPMADENKIAALKNIISRTPCYFLELGSNFKEVPSIIKSFCQIKC